MGMAHLRILCFTQIRPLQFRINIIRVVTVSSDSLLKIIAYSFPYAVLCFLVEYKYVNDGMREIWTLRATSGLMTSTVMLSTNALRVSASVEGKLPVVTP